MGEVSKQQVLDLLYEVADGVDRVDAKMNEILVETRILNYEMELCLQQIADARSGNYEKVLPR
jgi:hypothetical protein